MRSAAKNTPIALATTTPLIRCLMSSGDAGAVVDGVEGTVAVASAGLSMNSVVNELRPALSVGKSTSIVLFASSTSSPLRISALEFVLKPPSV